MEGQYVDGPGFLLEPSVGLNQRKLSRFPGGNCLLISILGRTSTNKRRWLRSKRC